MAPHLGAGRPSIKHGDGATPAASGRGREVVAAAAGSHSIAYYLKSSTASIRAAHRSSGSCGDPASWGTFGVLYSSDACGTLFPRLRSSPRHGGRVALLDLRHGYRYWCGSHRPGRPQARPWSWPMMRRRARLSPSTGGRVDGLPFLPRRLRRRWADRPASGRGGTSPPGVRGHRRTKSSTAENNLKHFYKHRMPVPDLPGE